MSEWKKIETAPHETPILLAWTCDEKDKQHCRNPYGCHCKEIAALRAQNKSVKAERDVWYDAAQTAIEKAMVSERERDAARRLTGP